MNKCKKKNGIKACCNLNICSSFIYLKVFVCLSLYAGLSIRAWLTRDRGCLEHESKSYKLDLLRKSIILKVSHVRRLRSCLIELIKERCLINAHNQVQIID